MGSAGPNLVLVSATLAVPTLETQTLQWGPQVSVAQVPCPLQYLTGGGGGVSPKHPQSKASLTSPQLPLVLPSTEQGGSGLFPSVPACPPWLAGLALQGASLGSPPPTQGQPPPPSPPLPRLCFVSQSGIPGAAVAVLKGHGQGSTSPWGCARLGLQQLPLHRAAKGAENTHPRAGGVHPSVTVLLYAPMAQAGS